MKKFKEVITIRKTDDNKFNTVSSRSHLIVRVNITRRGGGTNGAYFVDLAGREGGGGFNSGITKVGQRVWNIFQKAFEIRKAKNASFHKINNNSIHKIWIVSRWTRTFSHTS